MGKRSTHRSAGALRLAISLRVLAGLGLIVGSAAEAATLSVAGTLALTEGDAGDTRRVEFVVSSMSSVRLQSYGYGGSAAAPGGVDANGDVVPAGGFDPYLSLFAGTGNSASFVASNDDGDCGPGTPDHGLCGDATLVLTLMPGRYTLVISTFANQSLAENTGGGTLGDGMTGLGNFDTTRSNAYEIDIAGAVAVVDGVFSDGFE